MRKVFVSYVLSILDQEKSVHNYFGNATMTLEEHTIITKETIEIWQTVIEKAVVEKYNELIEKVGLNYSIHVLNYHILEG